MKSGQGIVEISIVHMDNSKFINRGSISKVEGLLDEYIAHKFSANLSIIKTYSMQILSPGDTVTIPIVRTLEMGTANTFDAFVATTKVGTYFDFVAYRQGAGNKLQTLTYSCRTLYTGAASGKKTTRVMSHSGDIGGLLHHMAVYPEAMAPGERYILGVIGYQTTPLWKFENQLPVVCLVDHSAHVIYMVPCPLDVVTIGERTTLGGLVAAQRVESTDRITVHALASTFVVFIFLIFYIDVSVSGYIQIDIYIYIQIYIYILCPFK